MHKIFEIKFLSWFEAVLALNVSSVGQYFNNLDLENHNYLHFHVQTLTHWVDISSFEWSHELVPTHHKFNIQNEVLIKGYGIALTIMFLKQVLQEHLHY